MENNMKFGKKLELPPDPAIHLKYIQKRQTIQNNMQSIYHSTTLQPRYE